MILTVSRQMGSLGKAVAEESARRLNCRMVWREVINQAALRAGVPEVALATIDDVGFLGLHPRRADMLAYHRAVRQVMIELAREGDVVIVGRAGQVILQDEPGAMHVRVIAPRAVRVARTAAEKNIPIEQAAGLVERSDLSRRNYLRRFYHAEVDDPSLYDLILNTEHLDVLSAAQVVCALVHCHVSVFTE
jgi:cytidylate kinase